jgi:hypothetical protein
MEQYRDLDGNSNVSAFEIERYSISVQFKDNSVYLYDYTKAGSVHVEQMKKLAAAGKGLNSYIMRHVSLLYTKRLM